MSWPVLPHGFLGSQVTGDNDSYQIERSLRFNSADSAYLNRTPASAGNRKTWTWSGWVKRSGLGTDTWVLRANSTGSDFFLLGFSSGNQFYLSYTAGLNASGENYTQAVFRDTSSWYHLVCSFDSTQATASNRIKLYVNGTEQTLAVSNPPALNSDYQVNTTNEHRIGGFSGSYANFYLTEINFIDGQALTPSSFGETDAITGRWKAKAYSGTYGTNGFYLPFSNNSSTITANLLTYSEEFNDASWGKFQSTITTNATTAPNGTTTAEKLVETVTTGGHSVFKSFTATDNTDYTFSCYLKASERNIVLLNIQKKDGTSYPKAEFNLTSGTIVSFHAGVTANITSVGSGWYRCSMTVNVGTGATASPNVFVQHVTVGNGDGTSGFFLWGAQLEPTATLGQYLNTGATAITTSLRLGEDKSISTGGYNNWVTNDLSVTAGAGNDSLTDSPTNYGTISTTLTDDTYQISRSLRFNSADSAYLSRTPASAGNRKTWTWSGWVKRGLINGNFRTLFGVNNGSGSSYFALNITTSETLACSDNANYYRFTTQVFRDPSAWYHIVCVVDTTDATANNRIRFYVNGSEITSFSTIFNPAQNADLGINQAAEHAIGRIATDLRYFDGYLTEINFIDGQALTPDSFGVRDASTYLWKPKAYTGTYGTNGFYLNFSDNSGTTATTLGKDSSPNGNNWTPFNFQVSGSPASGIDSLVDTPTYYGTDTGAGGEARGDYATLNPLQISGATSPTVTNGNLVWTGSNSAATPARIPATIPITSGKWYFEVTRTDNNGLGNYVAAGITNTNASFSTGQYGNNPTSAGGNSNEWALTDRGVACNGSTYTNISSTIGTVGQNDVIRVCVDMDNKKIWFGKNATFSGTPASNTGEAFSNLPASVLPLLYVSSNTTSELAANFGQRPFAYTAPSGFRALRDYNKLPTPTGGVVRGNYATFNPLDKASAGTLTITNGNLDVFVQASGSVYPAARLTISPEQSSGKYQFEIVIGSKTATYWQMGLNLSASAYSSADQHATFRSDGFYSATLSGSWSGTPPSFTQGDIITITYDADAKILKIYKNGTLGPTFTLSSIPQNLNFGVFADSSGGGANYTLNTGQRPFAYPVFGFKALCTTNLPTPTIKKPSSYMDVVTYTGTGATQSITGLGFSPDLLWLKNRTLGTGGNHVVFDSVRGGPSNELYPNLTNAEAATTGALQSLNTSGFTLGNAGDLVRYNNNTNQYVAWAWDEAPIAGMDIVSYTGNGTNRTIAHNLGVAPKMIIVKNRNFVGSTNWCVYHSSLSSPANSVFLDTTDAQASYPTVWNSTAPTSSVFSVGTNLSSNGNGNNMIAYLFAEVEGFSKFGSYTGNGSADGPFVWCGFRPAFVLVKRTDTTSDWILLDSKRSSFNVSDDLLFPNTSSAEFTNDPYTLIDFLSVGFKIRASGAIGNNQSGSTWIFAAFAESPFKYARAR